MQFIPSRPTIIFRDFYKLTKLEEIVNVFFNVPPENVPPFVTSLNTVPPLTEPPVYSLYELPDTNSGNVI